MSVKPVSGIRPMFWKAITNLAFLEAKAKSHARAILIPAPAATSLTAAMNILSLNLISLRIKWKEFLSSSSRLIAPGPLGLMDMSAPAEKALPAPVIMPTLLLGSLLNLRRASNNSA